MRFGNKNKSNLEDVTTKATTCSVFFAWLFKSKSFLSSSSFY